MRRDLPSRAVRGRCTGRRFFNAGRWPASPGDPIQALLAVVRSVPALRGQLRGRGDKELRDKMRIAWVFVPVALAMGVGCGGSSGGAAAAAAGTDGSGGSTAAGTGAGGGGT